MHIYCTGCEKDVNARLTNGKERYPHRTDLYQLPFWKCDTCGNYVGCHHKTNSPTNPLGVIATPEIVDARKKIHALLDPLWKTKKIKRGQAYAYISHRLGYGYHNGQIRTIDEARTIYKIVGELHNELATNQPTKADKEKIMDIEEYSIKELADLIEYASDLMLAKKHPSQASEDIDDILFEAIESAGSYIHKLTATEADYIQEQAKEAILAIIRNEKLKLLAEVREQAGEYELNMHGFYDKDVSDQITAVPLEALTKLEEEL